MRVKDLVEDLMQRPEGAEVVMEVICGFHEDDVVHNEVSVDEVRLESRQGKDVVILK